ncbi:DUF2809 domain-containing protein [Kitasatospora cineracea]|uniref:Uncharacterized protein DUF2809 n=1 Tax=Kitasatospora cineracea TaxID=88074 RepID=A0A3N4RUG3_9ACTN|nr:DUF2809 domain-containing protein [Kitasatospora cineracea]RPE36992.1 uncharacterized protein DUF2809 [Kitasatospora cineracea]
MPRTDRHPPHRPHPLRPPHHPPHPRPDEPEADAGRDVTGHREAAAEPGPRGGGRRPGEWRARAGWTAAAGAVLAFGLVAPGLVPAGAASLLGGALYTALLYTLLSAAAPRLGPWTAGAAALAAGWAVELFQLTGLPADLGRHSRLARLVLGTTFDPADLLGYALGAAAATALHLLARRPARRGR